ncbi:MAG TPA: hypothetical protein VEC39_21080 [Vicinamibacterales bacterium]|nr:hypothetical protein [Vicinamibacterales bacterium]
MKRTLCCVSLLFAMACSQSPTAPTSAPSIAAQLRWNVASTSCAPVGAPPSQPPFTSATIVEEGDGSVVASWPYLHNNRTSMLYARFVKENGGFAMCSWDIADI